MKLLFCCTCGDIFELGWRYKQCSCGNASGFHISKDNVVYSGKDAIVLGIHNDSLKNGILNRPLDGRGYFLYAWVIPYYCASTIKVDNARLYYKNVARPQRVHEDWLNKLNKIRENNLFLKIIYNLSKRYLFPSLNEYDLKKYVEYQKSALPNNSANLTDNSANLTDNSANLTDNSANLTDNSANLTDNSANLTDNSANLTDNSANLTDNGKFSVSAYESCSKKIF